MSSMKDRMKAWQERRKTNGITFNGVPIVYSPPMVKEDLKWYEKIGFAIKRLWKQWF